MVLDLINSFTYTCDAVPVAAAGGAREPAPRHDGRVWQVEVEPAGDGGPIPRRRGQGAPVARCRGPHRARGAVTLHRGEATVGALPRAVHGRAPLPRHRRHARRHPQVAADRGRVRWRAASHFESLVPAAAGLYLLLRATFCRP
jgi:hypothetical protein